MADIFTLMLSIGQALVAGADRFMVVEAHQRRLAAEAGISLGIPDTKINDVTDQMREEILTERAKVSALDWLRPNGPRDRICMAHGLMRDQVAGVLSAKTRRERNGGTDTPPETDEQVEEAESADSGSQPSQLPLEMEQSDQDEDGDPPPPPEDLDTNAITHDPATWPARAAKNGAEFPPKGAKEYDSDETDLAIVQAILDEGDNDLYQELRRQVAITRRLTGQQVAELKARITRKANSTGS